MTLAAIQSYWFKPFGAKLSTRFRGGFPHEKYFWASAGLSAALARRIFPKLEFHTNSEGAKRVEEFALPFDQVHCTFDSLKAVPEFLWAYGKMLACELQSAPFIHLDLDAFLFDPLPSRLVNAGVFGQTIESGPHHFQYYSQAVKELSEFPEIPADYEAVAGGAAPFEALNCGIVGGTNLAVLQSCLRENMRIMDSPAHASAWEGVAKRHTRYREAFNCAIEQVNLSLHCRRLGLRPEVLFETDPLTGAAPQVPGYVHLVGEAKSDASALRSVVGHLREIGPDIFERIERQFGKF